MIEIPEKIKQFNEYTKTLTEYTNELRDRAGSKELERFAEMRGFSMEVIEKQKIFYVGDATEMLLPSYVDKLDTLGVISPTNRRPIFHDRFIMPIMDEDGNILNLVGYSKEADERYVYGTARYYRRRDTLYGLESINKAYEMGYALLTEGITDAIRMRDIGHVNSFASCGTHSSDFIMKKLNRCRYGIIKLPDRDNAGYMAAKRWKCNRSVTLNTFIAYKDPDEMCRESDENKAWLNEYLTDCINWIKSAEHNGYKCADETLTVM